MPVCRFCDCSASPGVRQCPSCGAELPYFVEDVDPSRLEAEIRGMMERGDVLAAIEFFRDVSGATLAEARAAVARLKAAPASSSPSRRDQRRRDPAANADEPRIDAALMAEILALLARGQKVQAITACSIRAGLGIEETRNLVEAVAAARPVRPRRRIGVGGMVLIGWLVLGILGSLLS